ncbi:recombinase RecT, partial [Enterococcus faecalis]|nr:recombinase RecT [Enterococcus faecalis]MDT6903556.1 recombinase RecT [Enterococcus faecalis]
MEVLFHLWFEIEGGKIIMATNETLKNQLSQQNQKQVPANQLGLKGLM